MLTIIVLVITMALIMALGMASFMPAYQVKNNDYAKQARLEKLIADSKLHGNDRIIEFDMDGTTEHKIKLITDAKRKNLFKNVEIDRKTGNVYLITDPSLLEEKTPIQKPVEKEIEQVKEIAQPQINNYNFENIGKGLLALGGVLSVIFGVKYGVRLFSYLKTIRRFSKNEKRTNYLLNKVKVCFDDQKELLLLSDSIEHQLRLNDLLLRSDDAKQHGLHLQVADGYLYSEYNFINNNLLNKLK